MVGSVRELEASIAPVREPPQARATGEGGGGRGEDSREKQNVKVFYATSPGSERSNRLWTAAHKKPRRNILVYRLSSPVRNTSPPAHRRIFFIVFSFRRSAKRRRATRIGFIINEPISRIRFSPTRRDLLSLTLPLNPGPCARVRN